MMVARRRHIITTFICLALSLSSQQDLLYKNFVAPPQKYKPATWMHAMSGNMSKEGFTKDLESIARVGIGKVLLFNVTQGIPNGPVKYASPQHFDIIQHAIKECDRLGIEFGVHNCDGWSSSGGPWVKPDAAMKMVVWSEKKVSGGTNSISIPQPTIRENYYKEIAIIAYPALKSEMQEYDVKCDFTSSDPIFNIDEVTNQKESTKFIRLKSNKADQSYIQLAYDKPTPLRSITVIIDDRTAEATLQYSDDGLKYKQGISLLKVRTGKGEWAISDNFEAITAKYFRISFSKEVGIKKVHATTQHLVKNHLSHISMARTEAHQLDMGIKPDPSDVIDPNKIILLNPLSLQNDTTLSLSLPSGMWTVMRFGYTTTAAVNIPSSKEGKGLEVDKFSKQAIADHFEQFVKKIKATADAQKSTAFRYSEIDSYEMGGQNWTNGLDTIFAKKFNENLLLHLPSLAGKYVSSADATEQFLDNFRGLCSDLMVENYFGHFKKLCNENNIKAYLEPYGFGPFNHLDAAKQSDLTMGEFWMNRTNNLVTDAVDAADIYQRELVSAESFTSMPEINWSGNPRIAKVSGDMAWVSGINEFMFHRFVHQPNTHVLPGMTMNRWGFHFDRTQTWWEDAGKAWFEYMSRGQYLLRLGHTVKDLLVFVGDLAPNGTLETKDISPKLPIGIKHTNINADALLHQTKLVDDKLTFQNGSAYPILYLHNTSRIKFSTLKKLADLADQGLIITGQAPSKCIDYGLTEAEKIEVNRLFKKLSDKIVKVLSWQDLVTSKMSALDLVEKDGKNLPFIHRRYKGLDLYFVVNNDTVSQDYHLTCRVGNKVPELWDAMDGKMVKMASYSFTDKNTTSLKINLFAGQSKFLVFREETTKNDVEFGGITPILTSPRNTKYIVANENKEYSYLLNGNSKTESVKSIQPTINLHTNWTIEFPNIKAVRNTNLFDWSKSTNDSIKYFSGSAVYHNQFTISHKYLTPDSRVLLSFDSVSISAKVYINDQLVGVSWYAPDQLDVTKYIKKGNNKIKIVVTNQWTNKLVGDERYPDTQYQGYRLNNNDDMVAWYTDNEPLPHGPRTTFTTADFVSKTTPLLPSGLMGKVRLIHQINKAIKI
jgi:hypothetical protein